MRIWKETTDVFLEYNIMHMFWKDSKGRVHYKLECGLSEQDVNRLVTVQVQFLGTIALSAVSL